MLTSIHASNFKSWEELPETRLAPVTGLFGTNSSGKTSILQLLLLLKQTVASTDRRQVLNLGGNDRSAVALGLFRDLLYRHEETRPFHASVSWTRPEALDVPDPEREGQTLFESTKFGFTAAASLRSEQITVDEMGYTLGENSVTMRRRKTSSRKAPNEYDLLARINGNNSYLKRVTGRPWPLPSPAKIYGFPDEANAYFKNAGFLGIVELEFEQQLSDRLYYLGPLRSHPLRVYSWQGGEPEDVGERGERSVEALLASRARGRPNARKYDTKGRATKRYSVEEHVAEWLKDLDLIADFSLERIAEDTNLYRVAVQRHGSDTSVLLTDVGFGVSQVLPVLVLLAYAPEGSTVILEQPEIHLHPAVQAGLADIIIESALIRRVQVIVESHSEHLLRRLQLRTAEERIAPDEVALYFCDHDGKHSCIEELQLTMFGEIRNWPESFFGNALGETADLVRIALKRRRERQR